MQNGDRKLLPGDSFPVYLSWRYVFYFFYFVSSFLLNRTCNAGNFFTFVCIVLKLEKMKKNKINNDYIAKYNL